MSNPTCPQCDCVAGCQAKPELCPNVAILATVNPAPGYCKTCKDYTIEEHLFAQPKAQP